MTHIQSNHKLYASFWYETRCNVNTCQIRVITLRSGAFTLRRHSCMRMTCLLLRLKAVTRLVLFVVRRAPEFAATPRTQYIPLKHIQNTNIRCVWPRALGSAHEHIRQIKFVKNHFLSSWWIQESTYTWCDAAPGSRQRTWRHTRPIKFCELWLFEFVVNTGIHLHMVRCGPEFAAAHTTTPKGTTIGPLKDCTAPEDKRMIIGVFPAIYIWVMSPI